MYWFLQKLPYLTIEHGYAEHPVDPTAYLRTVMLKLVLLKPGWRSRFFQERWRASKLGLASEINISLLGPGTGTRDHGTIWAQGNMGPSGPWTLGPSGPRAQGTMGPSGAWTLGPSGSRAGPSGPLGPSCAAMLKTISLLHTCAPRFALSW